MQGFPAAGFLVNLGVTAALVLVLMGATLAVALRVSRHDVVDVVWGLGFCLIAVATFALSSGEGNLVRRLVVTVLTVAWGARLAIHIGRRNRGKSEDPRYREILAKARGNRTLYALRVVYLPQGAVMWFVSLPVQAAQYGADGLGPLAYVAVVVWLVGFVFEAGGDWQLERFTADPANKDKVLDRGLWRYTRHPNYFGDACVWWGLYLLACHHWVGAATILSPVVMTYLLARGTGKPLLEKDITHRRPGYADYIRRTSGFVPLPPKRSSCEPARRVESTANRNTAPTERRVALVGPALVRRRAQVNSIRRGRDETRRSGTGLRAAG